MPSGETTAKKTLVLFFLPRSLISGVGQGKAQMAEKLTPSSATFFVFFSFAGTRKFGRGGKQFDAGTWMSRWKLGSMVSRLVYGL